MSGVLRRGSLNFDCNGTGRSARGSCDQNLYGDYRNSKPSTPEISVICLDFRRYSEDLKKDAATKQPTVQNSTVKDLSQDADSDEISNYMGHFGLWQFVWTFTLCLFQLPPTLHMFAFVFQTAHKDFWCVNGTDTNTSLWQNASKSMDDACYADSNGSICTKFEFSREDGAAMTLVEEFVLVCERKSLLSVVEMCFLAGAAVGSVSSGWISDRFGRKHTLMGSAFVQAVFGILLAFSSSLAMFMTLRVIIGFASMTVTVVSFVLVVELVSGKWRTIIGILNILPVALTYVFTAGIAYFIRDWRHLQLVITLPGLLLLFTWYCVPESPRWLLARGRLTKLYVIIERAARMNGHVLPANYKKSLEAVVPINARVASGSGEQADAASPNSRRVEEYIDCNANPLKVVFGKRYCRTTCLNLVVWVTLILIYFGLTLHLSSLGGNIYLNTAIVGSVEAISICFTVFVVLKLGLRRNLIAFMLIPGICCLATNLVPGGEDNMVGVIVLAMIAKCVIGANNAIIPTYTAMQYPTVVRNFGVGMGNLAAGVGLILVPYMWLLAHVDPLLPLSIMGVCGLIGAAALVMMKDEQHT